MDHLFLEVDDPTRRFTELVAALDGPWQIDDVGRAEAMGEDGITRRIGLSRPPDGPWILAWSAEAEIPDIWSYGAMVLAILMATAAIGGISAIRGPGLFALGASAATLAGTLWVARRVIPRWLPSADAQREQLRSAVLQAVEALEGTRIVG